jgi:arylsulfatase A-like enzyme
MAAGGVAAAIAARRAFGKNPAKRPNVLFIAVDDWNDWVGRFGGNQAKTPNLDRLAKRGTSFRYAHANATYCAPSRTSLMTGRQPHTTGFYHDEPHFVKENSPELVDLPACFRKNGYYVAGGGKLYHHMPGFIDMRGWDEYFHWNPACKKRGWGLDSWEAPAPLPVRVPFSPVIQHMTGAEPIETATAAKRPKVDSHMEFGPLANEDEPKMADTICTKWAAEFLGAKRDKPFFLGFGLYAPHKPNYAPQKYFDMYPLAKVKAPKPHPGDLDDLGPETKKHFLRRKKRVHDHVVATKCRKRAVQGYLAALSYADAMIGRVLDALDAGPHADNTIIVLWSDNGYHLGEKFAWAKHTLWERTSNVPLLFAGPNVSRAAVVDTTVSLLDVYPTLTDLARLPANKDAEGISLAPVLCDPKSAKDRTVIQTAGPGEFSMINQSWRYIHHASGEEELYDLKADPDEHHNLAGKPGSAKVLTDFRTRSPKEFAKQGMGIHAGNLRPRFKGERFEWRPWSRPKKRKKKGGAHKR